MPAVTEEVVELRIERLGRRGDGEAVFEGQLVHIPYSLPGESVCVQKSALLHDRRGTPVSIVERSPHRVEPVCRYFGRCGGCAVQHLETKSYLAWKRDLVAAAFHANGIEVPVADVLATGPGGRRRAAIGARRTKKSVQIGYRSARSHDLVPIERCPLLLPAFDRLLAGLAPLVSALASRRTTLRLQITQAENGFDVAVDDARRPLDARARAAVAQIAPTLGIIRLYADGEPVYQADAPFIMLAGVQVNLPPGAFLQATRESEAELQNAVVAACEGAAKIADLFCGVGTFTLPLARQAPVTAVESDAAALSALAAAARLPGFRRVTTQRRDLFRDPLSIAELDAFDAVVFDPPRAGAEAQAKMIAGSGVKRVVAVSCNPETLARDLRMLVEGNYVIQSVQPVDQFIFSRHVEVVAVLTRHA